MKQHKITIGTISEGFREETYLLKDDVLRLIEEKMTDIELCYIDDPDNCADDDERWIILNELKQKLKRKTKTIRYCIRCKKPMYSSNENIWIKNKNYDIHKKCKGENKK